MRPLALVIAACSCSSSSSSGPAAPVSPSAPAAAPAPSTAAPAPSTAAPKPPPPTADRLEPGNPIARAIRAGEAHRYRFELAAGSAAIGLVMQDGIDVALNVFDPAGRKLAELDSPNGTKGPEPFAIEATAAGAYDLEVRPFDEPTPPAGAAPPANPPRPPAEGRYEIRLDEVLTADAYAERKARDRIASPRLLEVWRAVRAKDQAAIGKFWSELAGRAPIVEPYPGDPRDVLVTFVLRSTGPYVGMLGGPDFREKPLVRLAGSDLWYLSARMPADSRFEYSFLVAADPPAYRLPYRKDRGPDERLSKRQLDPNNPLPGQFGQSRVELPGAPPQPWIAAKPEVPRGKLAELKLESAQLEEPRRIGVYTPPGYDPKHRYPLLIAFDGEAYGLDPTALIPLPTILDNLIAAKKIPPVVAALVANQGTRERDLPGSAAFSAFVAKELVPRLRADHHAGLTPGETIVTGSSFGGLCSAYLALHHSDVIGNVLSQSGSYQYVLGSLGTDLSPSAEGGWLIREYAAAPKRPLRFYLDAGLFEAQLLESNRRMRDVLVAKGYPLTYVELSGGHDYVMWRGTISDGLIALLAKRP